MLFSRPIEVVRSNSISAASDPLRPVLWGLAAILGAIALALTSGRWFSAAGATAGPFLTLAAVIVGGFIADWIGVFRLLARAVIPERASGRIAFALVLSLTAIVSGVVNLDVAVVVATPLAFRLAHRRRLSGTRLAIAVALTANATSFLLPTSNLTNLLVLDRAPLSVSAYLRESWVAWILVAVVTVAALAVVLGEESGSPSVERSRSPRRVIDTLIDLVPMFLAAAAIRALLGTGLTLPGGFIEQFIGAGLLAAAVNNLPAAAAVHAVGATSQWAAISAMAMGPNIFLTGSVATLICRRIAHDHGAGLPLAGYSLVGIALLPLQVLAAVIGFKLMGAI